MKLGIIRCAQTEDFCPGTADFKTIQAKAGAFAGGNRANRIDWFCELRQLSGEKSGSSGKGIGEARC